MTQHYKWKIESRPFKQPTLSHNKGKCMNTFDYSEINQEIQALSSEIQYLVCLLESLKKEVDRFIAKTQEIKL